MDFGREWEWFAGAAFALMGGSTLLGAGRSARWNASWQGQRRTALGLPASPQDDEHARRAWSVLYRALGLFFLAGAVLILSGSLHFQAQPARVVLLAGGLLLIAVGTIGAWNRLRRLEALGGAAERAADACGWSLLMLCAAFGLRLLVRGLR